MNTIYYRGHFHDNRWPNTIYNKYVNHYPSGTDNNPQLSQLLLNFAIFRRQTRWHSNDILHCTGHNDIDVL